MSSVLANLPSIVDQHELNRRRGRELEADSFLASLDHRIETDRFGQIIMMPPPGFQHSDRQTDILLLLDKLMSSEKGKPCSECPVSTSGGVKGVDVVWLSHERRATALADNLLLKAPEVCVEVSSPSNTKQELEEKRRLYFEAGAEEIWICGDSGEIAFFLAAEPQTEHRESVLCPEFPAKI